MTTRLLLLLVVAAAGFAAPIPSGAATTADLRPESAAAFQRYIRDVEADVDQRVSGRRPFLWLDDAPARRARAQGGDVVTARTTSTRPREVPGGLVHDFTGAVFIPGATLAQTLAFVQDYDNHGDAYGPEIVASRIVSRDGQHFVIDMRMKKHKVITVVLNTRHDAWFFPLDPTRWHSRSQTTKVAEVRNAGTPEERELAPADGHGFMWTLNTYWRFLERDGGTYVECQAVSLSRGIPWGLGWLIGPIVNDLPGESVGHTLACTRAGVQKRTASARQ